VTDYVVVSSRQDFLDAYQPAIDLLESWGRTTQTLLTSKYSDDIRNDLCPIYESWNKLGKRPTVILVGTDDEDVESERNILGAFYVADSTGMFHFTSDAPSDLCLVDFDGDLVADLDYTRVSASSVQEVENHVASYVLFHSNPRSPSCMFQSGDLNSDCVVVDEPAATLWSIFGEYWDKGYNGGFIRDSDFPDCSDLEIRRDHAVDVINGMRPVEWWGSGWVTWSQVGPALMIQDAYDPFWDRSLTNSNQPFVAWFPGCNFGESDRGSTLCTDFVTGNPETGSTAAFWTSLTRGAWGTCHIILNKELGNWRFSPYNHDTVEMSCNAVRRLGNSQQGMRNYLATVRNHGGPCILEGYTVSVDDSDVLSSRVIFNQPYPNPCTTSSLVRFSLPTAMHTRVDVFDVSGRVVDTLVDGILDPGWTTLAWTPGTSVGAGMYYCRISAGSTVLSKEIMLVK